MEARHNKSKHFLHHGLFDDITTFSSLERRIENLETNQARGDAFEVFAQAYLATQKIVQAKSVWPFEHLPENLKQTVGIDTPRDMGVDGAFETVTGGQCAYQVKFRTGRLYLTWTELSTFMGLTEQADKRVLFTNCDDIPELMNDRSDFYCIRGSDLDRLDTDDFSAIKAWLEAGQVKFKQYEPLPHQKKALQKIESAFNDANRATVVMACGTGKTLVQLWAAEMLDVKSVLVLVPSLALIRQTLHEWLKQTKWEQFSYLCVCSDPSVARGSDEVVVRQSELDFPVTTNSADVGRYLSTKNKGPHIVFSTYQSAQALAEGMPADYAFNLGFFDEAHKTAGREGTRFAYALSDDNLRINKRLFMTATPRHYDIRKKDKEGDSKLVYSMDVPEIYGETVYSLQFRQAVKDKLICDYKVLISVVTDEEIDDWQLSHGDVVVKGDTVKARQVANQIALKNAVDNYGVHRIFTFHKSVASAKSFTSSGGEGINSELPDFLTVHVNGAMSAAKRSNVMREFAEADQAVISNARCLTEGVDVPAVDMVAFLSPKKSKVDIVQATGRAMRKSPGKEVGYVLIPLYLEQEKDETLDEALERTDFSEIWNVLQAMKEQDDNLADVIKSIQEERGKTGGYDDNRLREHLEVLGPALNLAILRNSVITQCIERLGDTWDLRFGELKAYKEEYGDCNVPKDFSENHKLAVWVNNQRANYKQGGLGSEQVKQLEEIEFEWKVRDANWEMMFNHLELFINTYGHSFVPRVYPDVPKLGFWINNQRTRYKQGKINKTYEERLNNIGFVWSIKESTWEERFNELKEYKAAHGTCDVSLRDPINSKLGPWVRNQRAVYKKGTLSAEYIKRLEQLGFTWNTRDALWEERFRELQEFQITYGHCHVPNKDKENPPLSRWVGTQRKNYINKILDDSRVERLVKLGFIWDTRHAAWEERFKELQEYKDTHGHCNVLQNNKDNPKLGIWLSKQRNAHRSGKIDPERARRLEELGIVWNPNEKAS